MVTRHGGRIISRSYHVTKQQFRICGKTLLPLIYKAFVGTRRKYEVGSQADFAITSQNQ